MRNRVFFSIAVLAVIFGLYRIVVVLLGEPATANGYLAVLGLCSLASIAVFVTASWAIHAAKVQERSDKKPLVLMLGAMAVSVGIAVAGTFLSWAHPGIIVGITAACNALAAAVASQAVLYG